MMSSTKSQHWTPRAVSQRAIQVLREEGVAALWFKVLGETVYRRVIVIECPPDEPIPDVRALMPVVIGWLDETQVDDYVGLRPAVAIDAREIRHRLRDGQWCFTARCDGRLVYVSWSITRCAWVDYLQREIQLAPDEVYSYETFTAPESRGLKIASMAHASKLRYFRASGYRRLVAVVMPENRGALNAFQKIGYRSCGTMGYVRLGPWRRDFFRPVARRAPNLPDWSETLVRFKGERHYLDPFLARLKKDAHVQLIARWGGVPRSGLTLKTDLFEEAAGGDAFLHSVSEVDRAVGMDLSPAITLCAKEREPRSVYLAADVRSVPFAPNSFALIISPSTLDHFVDPEDLVRSLRELARVLMPGGCLIITLDNRQNVTDPLLRVANRLGWLPYFVGHSLTIRELRAALESIGLRVTDTTAILHNPRLFAVALKMLSNKIGWRHLTGLVERALLAAQRLDEAPLRYYTGSFIAARAVKPENQNDESD